MINSLSRVQLKNIELDGFYSAEYEEKTLQNSDNESALKKVTKLIKAMITSQDEFPSEMTGILKD